MAAMQSSESEDSDSQSLSDGDSSALADDISKVLSRPGPLMDGFLAKLAQSIKTEDQAELLGYKLKFTAADINRFRATNRLDGTVTRKGTRQMLFEWRRNVEPCRQAAVLRKALQGIELADASHDLPGQKESCQDVIQPLHSYVSPMRRKSVEQCIVQTLRSHYKTVLCPIQRRPWDPTDFVDLKQLFTHVNLVKYDRGSGELKKIPLEHSVDGILELKVDRDVPMRLLMTAPGGHGKTCAVAKLAYDWAHNVPGSPMHDVFALFVLKMREIKETMSLGDAIVSQLTGVISGVTPEGIESFIEENQDQCMLICDGYDEFGGSIKTRTFKGWTSLIQVLRNKKLKDCRVLVTSRPFLEGDFLQGELARTYTKLEIEGFSRESATEHIARYFASRSNSRAGEDLLKYLKKNVFLTSLIKVPLFCTMVCHLFEVNALSDTRSMCSLFKNINHFLLHHAMSKETDILPRNTELDDVIKTLGKVAFHALMSDSMNALFKDKDFSECPESFTSGVKLAILSSTTIPLKHVEHNNLPTATTVEFFHKLEQEFCASMYLLHQLHEDQNTRRSLFRLGRPLPSPHLQCINTVAKTLEFNNVLCFLAGASAYACHAVFKHIAKQAKDFVMFYKCQLILHCIVEADSTYITRRVICALQKCFWDGILDLYPLTDRILMGMEQLPQAVKSKITTVFMSSTSLSLEMTGRLWSCLVSFDHLHKLYLNAVSLTSSTSLPPLPSVKYLEVWSLPVETFDLLIDPLNQLEELEVRIGYDGNASDTLTRIAQVVSRTGKTLRSVTINGVLNCTRSHVSPDECQDFGQLLKNQAPRLERLKLVEVNVAECGLVSLITSCQHLASMKEISLDLCVSMDVTIFQNAVESCSSAKKGILVAVKHPEHPRFCATVKRIK
ncbi:uncharacterized protein [Diadema setosum]|uniref:uncharacterized protein n=1 Tax=Diadema setosum TaxID=31175 RepID=UPI003B3B52A8